MSKFLALLVIISTVVIMVFGFQYLYVHWDEIFGPKAEKFCTFCREGKTVEELIDHKICYKATWKFSVEKDMYFVEISDQERSNIDEIIEFADTSYSYLKEGAVKYPSIVVRLREPASCGTVNILISFRDVDNHEKQIIQTEKICPPPPPHTPTCMPKPTGFEATFAIVGLLAIAYLLRRRK